MGTVYGNGLMGLWEWRGFFEESANVRFHWHWHWQNPQIHGKADFGVTVEYYIAELILSLK